MQRTDISLLVFLLVMSRCLTKTTPFKVWLHFEHKRIADNCNSLFRKITGIFLHPKDECLSQTTAFKPWWHIVFLISLVPFSSGLDFDFNSPDEVSLNEEFLVSFEADVSESYDVKIYVATENGTTLSQIDNNGWKNPYYYLKGAFPSQSSFNIRVVKAVENAENFEICTRLRKTGKTTAEPEFCKPIKVNYDAEESPENEEDAGDEEQEDEDLDAEIDDEDNEDFEEKNLDENDEDEIEDDDDDILPNNYEGSEFEELRFSKPETEIQQKIFLNPKSEQQGDEIFITKEEKLRLWIFYSFALFCVVLLVLMAWNKL